MSELTRREFGALAIGAVIPQVTRGVHLGVQTYSFRDIARPPGAPDSVDVVIEAMHECGLDECELYSNHVEPRVSREELRAWRTETSVEHFRSVKRKFDAAGIAIYAYCYNMNPTFTDAEIDRGFEIAKALGARVMDTSTTLEVARRVAPIAVKHRMHVGLHGHSNTSDPNEFSSPQSFAAAMTISPYFKVNLDIGHFTAAGFDAVSFIREHHADITNLHVKDMKRNQPDSYVPWGQGDTPIRNVLQLLKKERWPIPAYIEYEYRGEGTPAEEVTKCLAYAKRALA